MRIVLCLLMILLFSTLAVAAPAASEEANRALARNGEMSRDIDPEKFLDEPFDRKAIFNTFNSFVSSLYALDSKLQVYGGEELVTREAHDIYPKSYTPTVREILDMVGWQTGSQWKFDPEHYQFEFMELPVIYPFTIKLAKGWKHQYRGMYVWFAPQSALVGMDIYYFGHLTPPKGKDPAQFFHEMRKFYSTLVLQAHGSKAIPDPDKDMVELTLAGEPALYWQPKTNYSGFLNNSSHIWRQWSVIIDGNAFLIVSTMDESSRDQVWKDVDQMLASFSINRKFNLRRPDYRKVSTGSDDDLINDAINLSTTLQSVESLDKAILIPMKSASYEKYLDDKDLGPYLAVAKADKYDSIVFSLIGGSSHNTRVTFFKGNDPVFFADIKSEKPPTMGQIRSQLKKLPPHHAKYRLHLAQVPIQLTADNGTPIHATEIQYIKAQPQPCSPDGSPEICIQ